MIRFPSARWISVTGLLAVMAGCSPPEADQTPDAEDRAQHLPTATIHVGPHLLVVEVADTEAEWQKGMKFRRQIGPDEAMLFIFEHDTDLPFWMKNCYVDLDLAYIRGDGTIAQISPLRAHCKEAVWSREPYRFALEVPAGWFEAHGIGVGAKVTIPPKTVTSGEASQATSLQSPGRPLE